MRLFVVGAGASYAECVAGGLPEELRMPLVKDLSRKLWADFNPTPFLEVFLQESGHLPTADPVARFFELERNTPGLIEDFFASAWRNRDKFHTQFSRRWDDLLYHGLLRPLNFILIRGLLANNPSQRFPLSEAAAGQLRPGDLVLNLNYDLIFDIALKNVGLQGVYSPHRRNLAGIWIFKPHGSFHLAVHEKERKFYFAQVEFIGDVQPADGANTFSGFVPPRRSKSFQQHPVASMIIEPLLDLRPEIVTFWGVGSPDSDHDLVEIYKKVCAEAEVVEFVNPSQEDANRVERQFGRSLIRHRRIEDWLERGAHNVVG